MSGLFSIFLVGASALLDPRRSEELGISQSTVLQPKWTENGTVYVNRTINEIERGKFVKPSGCSEMVLFGLYDWDCKSSGKRLLGYWPERTKCQVFCRTGQIMAPKAKKIQCRKNRKNGGKLQWKLKRSWDPDIKCISTYNVARWSGWSEWSDWTKCSVECGKGQKIRQRKRNCIGGIMGEAPGCPYKGNVQLEYGACDVQCNSPPEVIVSFPSDDIQDKSFKVKFETKNINSKDLSHFYLEVYRDVVEYGQVRYKIADFDTLSKNLDEMTIWREVEPLTRYEVWVTAKGYNNKQLADPTIKKVTTKMSRFDYDETQVCQVDWPQTFKDEMVTSCDHMDVVPAGHRCYTYCKDDWRKMRGTEYMTCMNGQWRGSWPKCEKRGWRCDFNFETNCDGCIRAPHCCEHLENEGDVRFICHRGYLRPEGKRHDDKGVARVLMKALNSDRASCITFSNRRRDCSLRYEFKVKAVYKKEGKQDKEIVLADVANDPEWNGDNCRSDEDYDTTILDVRPQTDYDTVQIVIEAQLDRHDATLGYDMWFDNFYHGYGKCSKMRCGEFPPPLLKGGGKAYGHDVGGKSCTDGDKVGSTCKMLCPSTHPVGHFAHYWDEINCLPSGYWSQPLYSYYTGYCQAPHCNFFDIVPPENGWYSCSHEGYEGSVCTFGCNSVDYKLDNKTPYRIECKNSMWVPTGGPKGFVAGKTLAKCVFNHAFARIQKKITEPLNPLTAMRRQYKELSGDVREPSMMRRERTNYNVEMVQRRFGQSTPNFQQVFHSFFEDDVQESFESSFEVFNMDDHM